MPGSARYRQVKLGPRGATIERDAQGRYLLKAKSALGPYPARLTERLIYWADRAPERTFVAKRDPARGGAFCHLSYGEALARAKSIAAALLERGLSAERPLMILSENDLEHALLALAALHVGVPFVPISPAYSLLSRDFARLRELVQLLTPGLVFAASGAQFARAIAATVPAETEVVLTRDAALLGRPSTPFQTLEANPAEAAVAAAHRAITPDTIAKFLLTSGSTGTPKAVVQTERMLTSNLQMIVECLPFMADEPPLIVDWLPWHHVFGGNHNFGLMLYNGGTLYIDEGRPTPPAFGETLRNLRELAPTIQFNVPRGFEELVRALERDRELAKRFFSRVKLLFYAAAGLSQRGWDMLEQLAEDACGERITMITGLGMTEASPFAICANWEDGRSGGIGLPAPGVELRLVPDGEKLEARYRGPSITPGFWRAPELTRVAFDEDGFYRTGDAVAFLDAADPERGLLFDGRLAEDFKLNTGTWVSVGPLRARALTAGSPYIQDVVVVGPDRRELGLLIVPHVEACRSLCPDLAPDTDAPVILRHPTTRAFFHDVLDKLQADATGSANRVTRALLLIEPLSIDKGEVTDKGSVVQRTLLRTRAGDVEALYDEQHPEVIRPR